MHECSPDVKLSCSNCESKFRVNIKMGKNSIVENQSSINPIYKDVLHYTMSQGHFMAKARVGKLLAYREYVSSIYRAYRKRKNLWRK